MKNSFHFYVFMAFVGIVMIAVGVKAADNDSVTATVTVQEIAVSLDTASFDYGTMDNNTSSSTLPLFSGSGIVATNDGNIDEDFDINGADTGDWTLAGSAGSDNYVHQFCNDTDNDCSSPPTNYTGNELTTTPTTLKSTVSSSGTCAFQLRITTPNPSTVYTQQSASVTVTASASS